MSKRFADTNLNREPWFRKLKPKLKCAVRFIFDECNNAGIWVIDMETLSYFVSEEVTLDEMMLGVNSDKTNRIEIFQKDKIFIPGFVEFQYGELSPNCKPHIHIINLLNKYGLFQRVYKGYTKGIHTLEEKDKERDKDILDKISVKKTFKKLTEKEFMDAIALYTSEFPKNILRDFYDYWREPDTSGKMRFQKEDTWDLKLRLERWSKNDFRKTKEPEQIGAGMSPVIKKIS